MTEKDPFETLLDRLAASTRSPRGRFSAARSWPLLQTRLKRRTLKRTLWMRQPSCCFAWPDGRPTNSSAPWK